MRKFLSAVLALTCLFGAFSPAQADQMSSLSVLDGSCQSPAVTFINDTDTGIFRSGANSIGICVGGVLVATINASGVAINVAGAKASIDQNKGRVNVAGEYSSLTASEQAVAGDLTLSGTDLGKTGGYLAGVMGNILGPSGLTAAGGNGSNTAGVIGKYTLLGTTYTPGYPRAGVLGEMAGNGDAAVVAVVSEGDAPSVNVRSYFGVDSQITASSTVKFGLDLKGPAHDVYSAATYTKAPIRLGSACVIEGAGVPNSSTGVDECSKGSIYLDITNGTLYQNTGTISSPTWTSR